MTSQGAPEAGAWKTVPVEPTDEMSLAGYHYAGRVGGCASTTEINGAYAAMLATSPSPPPGVGECCRGLAPKSECKCEQERPPVGVDVVRLEWREDGNYVYKCGTFTRYVADSPFDKIVIRRNQHNPNAATPYNHVPPYSTYFVVVGAEHVKHTTIEAAKAAAQADFERRIRSAIVPSSLLKEAEEALRLVRSIIRDAAETGFNCHDGDWAERLFASQAVTSKVVARLGAAP